jgi:hypothetical protein
MKRKHLPVILAAVLLVALTGHTWTLLLCTGEAHAVVGRPLTPMSYAGVARRTARRTNAAYATVGAVPAGAVTTLPASCGFAGGVYTCGTVRYRPYYSGPTVVYQVVP